MAAPAEVAKRVGPPRGDPALEQRRQRVAELYAQGFSHRQIAAALSIDRGAALRDIKAVRRELRKSAVAESAEDVFARASGLYAYALRETALAYMDVKRASSPGPGGAPPSVNPVETAGLRMSLLQSLASFPEKQVRLGQTLGLIKEAPQQVEVIDRFRAEFERSLEEAALVDPEAERVLRRIATR